VTVLGAAAAERGKLRRVLGRLDIVKVHESRHDMLLRSV
jgi:hypothetical protein